MPDIVAQPPQNALAASAAPVRGAGSAEPPADRYYTFPYSPGRRPSHTPQERTAADQQSSTTGAPWGRRRRMLTARGWVHRRTTDTDDSVGSRRGRDSHTPRCAV